ncbi:hypothetical protein A3A46_00735 [Candidatus Roizmanbacteria bacterium RIFCSPLOWO2_01_FULL_37_13]|uniref:HEAT repeat domain-containing protein n=1 Tax=Candidatus Roizmanbacteria bacterium RIFCSPHIGHO2_02_FULL_38_11 TaxID=1802039 RepID=A0A1F7H0F7_9BACT|nr:MAG: hypothetical protein A3C25_01455 [Candidatus Roizmanbacteria bacterium RIFCSPHIGHO2_02_FULL_38_11]OGK34115.1 MAG: hypothetical protein A3F58_03035 [Candidatus Roizmanbacteria bacterium RIFCSPHIGHO2_12_FULL_37_9b]OGK41752.1 MAG: hypothetical protein A3A46_00735 [Candidatus Roizmanbacteria bacterium RIFCSPLOWO2_01_FULL_37_13]
MDELVIKLLKKEISIYQAIDRVRKLPNKYLKELRFFLQFHKKAYIRLFSAWAIGECKDKKSFDLLLKRYDMESDNNVRANIVRALLFIDPKKVPVKYIQKFLSDKYNSIQLTTLKFLSFNSHAQRKLNFLEHFYLLTDNFVRMELLRNLRFFLFDTEKICRFLYSELKKTPFIPLQVEIIKAIGLANSPNSLSYLIRYYENKKKVFSKNPLLSNGFVSAIATICQSKAYYVLRQLYSYNPDLLLRWKIMEATVAFGGPNALSILKEMIREETDPELKKTIEMQIKNTFITTII